MEAVPQTGSLSPTLTAFLSLAPGPARLPCPRPLSADAASLLSQVALAPLLAKGSGPAASCIMDVRARCQLSPQPRQSGAGVVRSPSRGQSAAPEGTSTGPSGGRVHWVGHGWKQGQSAPTPGETPEAKLSGARIRIRGPQARPANKPAKRHRSRSQTARGAKGPLVAAGSPWPRVSKAAGLELGRHHVPRRGETARGVRDPGPRSPARPGTVLGRAPGMGRRGRRRRKGRRASPGRKDRRASAATARGEDTAGERRLGGVAAGTPRTRTGAARTRTAKRRSQRTRARKGPRLGQSRPWSLVSARATTKPAAGLREPGPRGRGAERGFGLEVAPGPGRRRAQRQPGPLRPRGGAEREQHGLPRPRRFRVAAKSCGWKGGSLDC